jgi:uracil-DNA glycosylase
MADKAERMAQIKTAVESLTESPLYEFRQQNGYHAVIGEGTLDADVMLVGEAPGENEAKQGRPFCGASGRVLDELLASIDLKRGDVYITNIVKDRPPENRNPHKKEIRLYGPFLEQQIDLIQPGVIATLGSFSMKFIFEMFERATGKISDLHGTPIEVQATYGPVQVLPLFHPAVSFYSPQQKDTLFEDFKALRELL